MCASDAEPESPAEYIQTHLSATALTSDNSMLVGKYSHDPYRRITDLLQRLAPGKMRIGFFLGAGCPLSVQVADGEGTKSLIPEITGLTKQVKASLDANDEIKGVAAEAWDRVLGRGIPNPTIEDVLSHIRTLRSLAGGGSIDGF